MISCSGFRSELIQKDSKLRNYSKKLFNYLYKKITRSPSQMEQFQTIAVKPNKQDKFFLEKNLEIYFEFPPIYKPPNTLWDDPWTSDNYPTPKPLIDEITEEEVNNSSDFYKNECKYYTWMCFARIKNH